MLALYTGETLQFLTLISSAREEFDTPTGIYNIYRKNTTWDLASVGEAVEPYYIEAVPWVMHYYPRYALHTAFWHDDFGLPASHGCINLSPKDAKRVFAFSDPELPDGWKIIRKLKTDPGTSVRIRGKSPNVLVKRVH